MLLEIWPSGWFMALLSLDSSIFKCFLSVLCQSGHLTLCREKTAEQSTHKLNVVYVNILYLKIYEFVLLG